MTVLLQCLPLVCLLWWNCAFCLPLVCLGWWILFLMTSFPLGQLHSPQCALIYRRHDISPLSSSYYSQEMFHPHLFEEGEYVFHVNDAEDDFAYVKEIDDTHFTIIWASCGKWEKHSLSEQAYYQKKHIDFLHETLCPYCHIPLCAFKNNKSGDIFDGLWLNFLLLMLLCVSYL